MSRPVGLLVALPEESAALRAGMQGVRRWGLPDYPAWRGSLAGREVVLAQSGMGHGHAGECARQLIGAEHPSVLVAAGFAGGLCQRLEPGEAVVASEVILVEGDSHRRWPARLDSGAIRKAVLASPDEVVRFRHEKRALAERTGAQAVDMESGSVVREAEAAGIPWVVVRSVTDGASEDLPMDFRPFTTRQGLPHKPSIVLHALFRPRTLWRLLRLGRRTSRAAESLRRTVTQVLEQL